MFCFTLWKFWFKVLIDLDDEILSYGTLTQSISDAIDYTLAYFLTKILKLMTYTVDLVTIAFYVVANVTY